MTKRIPIDEVVAGMQIKDLDRPWLETPFLRHSMTVTTDAQIEKLRNWGIRSVEIEAADNGLQEMEIPFEHLALGQIGTESDLTAGALRTDGNQNGPDATEQELPAARRVYREAKTVVQRALNDARMGREVNAEAVSRIVDGMTESLLRNADALTSLARIKSHHEYTFYHSVNTAVLALSMGRHLGMERGLLHHLGTGCMLHDIGKMTIPLRILNKPGSLRDFEFEIMKQHALRGAEILSSTTGLHEQVIHPALEHHERVNGTGYPFGKHRHAITQFGRISSVVDIYDAVTSDRVYHKGVPAHEALRLLWSLGQKGHLELELVARLIRCVGIYPVGSCVILDTGEIGIVTQTNAHYSLTPKVMLVRDANRRPIQPPVTVDLAQPDQNHGTVIMAALDPAQEGIDPHQYLDHEV
jgi:putative nucleotidyltransferase with HDIG domain